MKTALLVLVMVMVFLVLPGLLAGCAKNYPMPPAVLDYPAIQQMKAKK